MKIYECCLSLPLVDICVDSSCPFIFMLGEEYPANHIYILITISQFKYIIFLSMGHVIKVLGNFAPTIKKHSFP